MGVRRSQGVAGRASPEAHQGNLEDGSQEVALLACREAQMAWEALRCLQDRLGVG